MSTITKLDPVLRLQPLKMRAMAKQMLARYRAAETDDPRGVVYYAAYLAIVALLKDPMHGYSKGRLYRRIMAEYRFNMQKFGPTVGGPTISPAAPTS